MRTSEELLASLKARDVNAISELYDQYSGALHGVISRIVKSTTKADSVLEITFLKIIEEIHYYKNTVSLFTWMFCIARTAALESIAETSQHMRIAEDTSEIVVSDEDLKLFDGMPPLCQKVFACIYSRGFTLVQTSNALKISVEQVKSHLHNGLQYICNEDSHPAV